MLIQTILFVLLVNAMFLAASRLELKRPQDNWQPESVRIATPESAIRLIAIIILAVSALTLLLVFVDSADSWFRILFALANFALITHLLTKSVGGASRQSWLNCFPALGITAAWYFYPNWATINLAATLLGTYLLAMNNRIRIRTCLTFMASLIILTLLPIYLSGWRAAEGAVRMDDYPIALLIPKQLTLTSHPAQVFGLAEILLPGLVVMAAFRLGKNYGRPSFPLFTIAGYWVGLAVAVIVSIYSGSPQIALIYLLFGVFAGLTLASIRPHLFRTVFTD